MYKFKYDKPITNKENDLLNRNNYAEHIAQALKNIINNSTNESFVIGIYGAWGEGKTSFINLVLSFFDNFEANSRDKTLIISRITKYFIKAMLIWLLFDFNFVDFITNSVFLINIILSFKTFPIIPCLHLISFIIKILITYFISTRPMKIINTFFNKRLKKDDSSVTVINFAPWNITNHKLLVEEFFKILKAELSKQKVYNEIVKNIEKYMHCVCSIITKGCFNLYDNKCNESILILKNELKHSLEKIDKKIVVIIDDIDRLSDKEMLLVFKLVKSIADLTNIIYILSFDKNIVVNALNNYNNENGEAFLEKIIQVPIKLPNPTQKQLEQCLFRELDSFLNLYPNILEEWSEKYKDYWNNVANGFIQLFKNVRDINRFINALKIAYNPRIHNEINIIDFFVIIAFQVLKPDIYEFIHNNYTLLMSKNTNDLDPTIKEQINKEFQAILNNTNLNHNKSIQHLLTAMFPNTDFWGNKWWYSISSEEAFLTGRICHPEHYNKFFTLDIDNEQVSLVQIQQIIEKSDLQENFEQEILKLDKDEKTKEFLRNLKMCLDKIPLENVENMILALFNIGDSLKSKDENIWDTDINFYIFEIIYYLMQKNLPNKKELLMTAISKSKSLCPIVNYIDQITQNLEKQDGILKQDYVNKTDCQELTNALLDRLYLEAKNDIDKTHNKNKLSKHQKLLYLLYFWKKHGDQKYLYEYIDKVTKEDSNLLLFLEQFKYKRRGIYGSVYRESDEINKKDLMEFFNIDVLQKRLENLEISKNDENSIIKLVLNALNDKTKDYD